MKQTIITLPYQCGSIATVRKLLKREIKVLESESTAIAQSIDLSNCSQPDYYRQVMALAFAYWLLVGLNLVADADISGAFQPIIDLSGQLILEGAVKPCP